jgi:hypothetical protein
MKASFPDRAVANQALAPRGAAAQDPWSENETNRMKLRGVVEFGEDRCELMPLVNIQSSSSWPRGRFRANTWPMLITHTERSRARVRINRNRTFRRP